MRPFDDIADRLRAGSGLIVPTRSRAAAIRLAYAREQLRSLEVWRTPLVTAVNGWMAAWVREAYLNEGHRFRRPLGPHEEWCLWHDAARELLTARDDPRPFIWSTDALADALQQSARLCSEWRIDDASLSRHASTEAQWLLSARRAVGTAAREQDASASFEQGELLLAGSLFKSDGPSSYQTYLGGFIPPLLRDLFVVQGVSALQSVARADVKVSHHRLPTPADEVAAAAHWARTRLEQNSEARLYIVVPSLEAHRAEVERHFSSQLTPSRWRDPDSETLFDIEGGRPLAEYSEPRQVLQLLRWLAAYDEAEAFARLLEGEVFDDLSISARARLAALLRRDPFERRSARAWLAVLVQLRTPTASDAGVVQAIVQRLERVQAEFERSGQGWAGRFAAIAQQAVFEHRPARDSTTRQIREQWRELIQVFGEIERSRSAANGQQSVGLLASLAQREFVAPSRGELPVTITRSLDHPAVRYDGIYVCGMQADAWPSPARADPFMPYLLQRALGIPESSALGQSQRAQLAMRQWAESTPDLHYSSALRDGETELQPSPLLRPYDGQSASPPISFARARRDADPRRPSSEPADTTGIPWDAARRIPGGAETLATQALCDFRAYAERRLLGRQEEELEPGISALVRGSFLHRALHVLWRELIDSERLRALSARQLDAVIELSLSEALSDPSLSAGTEGAGSLAQQQLLARERRRSERVIRRLLELELRRPPFTVQYREHPVSLTLGEARLELRVDRIDRVRNGSESPGLMILDYKSGRHRPLSFSLAELDAVQLWLYALCVETEAQESIVALANIHLSSSACRYVASTDDGDLLPGVKAGIAWSEQRAEVHRELLALASRFMHGVASVRPSQRACRYCDLQGLCRRAELGAVGSIDIDSEEGAE